MIRRDAGDARPGGRGRAVAAALLLTACTPTPDGLGGPPSAHDFVGEDIAVTPGLASCAVAIGRPDLAIDPNGPMSRAEIEAMLACTAARARE